jgi:hypothetical protein
MSDGDQIVCASNGDGFAACELRDPVRDLVMVQ